jgi:hypothetical protein
LILDGHGSHLTINFNKICEQNNIIPICMPAHSSHLLQPLDIGCFAVLKRLYGRLVETKMRLGINHIDKLDFLEAYPFARIEAYKPATIKNSFAATGLIPFCPDRVLSKLDICLRTPTAPASRGSESSRNFTPKTPFTEKQLRRQASSIKALLRLRSQSPPSLSNRAINQLIKGCELALQNAIILAKENSELRAANEKQKQKRTRSTRQIAHEGDLSVQQVRELRAEPFEAQVARIDRYREQVSEGLQPRTRGQRGCGICRKPGHRRETCPDREIS